MVLERLVLGDLQTNCYILWDKSTKEAAVFDPACEGDRIIERITANGLNVKYIILTHTHIDHINALDKVKEYTGAKVVVHKDEAASLNSDADVMAFIINSAAPRTKADVQVSDGDELFLGDKMLKIIHTPGHTVGGICVRCGNILISGDTLFNLSVGRTDFKGGDHQTLLSSIREKIFALDGATAVYPGHGEATTVFYEKQHNPYLR